MSNSAVRDLTTRTESVLTTSGIDIVKHQHQKYNLRMHRNSLWNENSSVEWRSLKTQTPAKAGASCDIVFEDTSFILEEMVLKVTLAQIQNAQRYCRGVQILDRVEIYANGGSLLVQTISADALEGFLPLALRDEERRALYRNAGGYTDTERNTLSQNATGHVRYLPIKTLVDVLHIPLWKIPSLRFRFHFASRDRMREVITDPMANEPVVEVEALVKYRLPTSQQRAVLQEMFSAPVLQRFVTNRIMPYNFSALNGKQQLRIRLSSCTGLTPYIYFFITPSDQSIGTSRSDTVAIESCNLLSSSGTSLVGHRDIERVELETMRRVSMFPHHPADDSTSLRNVYVLSMCDSPLSAFSRGQNTGVLDATGSEQLIINVDIGNTNTYVVHIVCAEYQWLEYGPVSVSLIE